MAIVLLMMHVYVLLVWAELIDLERCSSVALLSTRRGGEIDIFDIIMQIAIDDKYETSIQPSSSIF